MARRIEIIDALRLKLFRNEFAPGEGIPEESVAAEFGASRTPIREALIALSREALVVNEANRGFRVASISIEAMRSYFELAQATHVPMMKLVRQRASAADLARLRDMAGTDDIAPGERIVLHFQCMTAFAALSRNVFYEQALCAGESYHVFVRMNVVRGLPERAAAASAAELLGHERNILDALDGGSDGDLEDVLTQMTDGTRTFLLTNLL